MRDELPTFLFLLFFSSPSSGFDLFLHYFFANLAVLVAQFILSSIPLQFPLILYPHFPRSSSHPNPSHPISFQCLSSYYSEELHCRPWWPPTDISDCLSIAPIRPLLPSLLPLPPLLNPPTTLPNTAAPTSKSSPLLPSSLWAPVPTSYS